MTTSWGGLVREQKSDSDAFCYLMAVIFGEMYFSVSGIGHLIMRYQAGLNTDNLMLLVVVTASFGVAMIALARRVEGWLGPWRQFREVE